MKCLMFVKPYNNMGCFGISIVRQNRLSNYREDGRWLLYWLNLDNGLQDDSIIKESIWKYRINSRRISRWF